MVTVLVPLGGREREGGRGRREGVMRAGGSDEGEREGEREHEMKETSTIYKRACHCQNKVSSRGNVYSLKLFFFISSLSMFTTHTGGRGASVCK